MMDLDELQSVRDRERQTDKLQQLRESFYADAGEFIQQLRRERDRAAERADDPFDAPEVNRLTDEINTAEQTVEAIFERRIGKIVKAASLAAADQPLDADGMTAEEQILFDSLVEDIVSARERVLDTLEGVTDGESDDGRGTDARDAADSAPEDRARGESSIAAADLMGSGADEQGSADGRQSGSGPPDETPAPPPAGQPGEPDSEKAGSEAGRQEEAHTVADGETDGSPDRPGLDGNDEAPVRKDGGTVARETVLVTDDVGEIFGVDEREYDLAADDVVQLPAANAQPLVERGAAERLD